jgi:hypothetical protein
MAFQFSSALRNARVQCLGAASVTPVSLVTLKIFSGAEPANCAAADPTGLLCTITLPGTYLTFSGGVTTLSGSWTNTASGTGTAASWRLYDGAGTPVCHVQGNMTDLVLNNTSITSGQTVTVTSFSVTDGNA